MYRVILLVVFVALIVGVNVYISVTPTQDSVFSRVSIVVNVLLVGLCVLVLIGAEKSITWSLVGFVVYLLWALMNVSDHTSYGLVRSGYVTFFLELNPGTYGIAGSILGGIIGKYFRKSGKDMSMSWARTGLVVGLFVSYCFMLSELFSRHISGS